MDPIGQVLLATGKTLSWLPAVLTPLLWAEGDTIVGGLEADPVSSWTDISGYANHPTATLTLRPTLRTNALNTYPVVEFDGSNDTLTIPNIMTGRLSGTLFAVVKNNADPGNGMGLFDIGGDAAQQDHYPYTDGNIYTDFASTARKSPGSPTPSMAAWHIVSMRGAAGAWDIRFNGSSMYTTATNVVGWTATPKLGNGGGASWAGRVAMFLLGAEAYTDAAVQKLEGYAAHKYGLLAVLPVDHPYKVTPPPYERPPTLAVRLDQQYVEVVLSGDSKVRLDQQYVEAVHSGSNTSIKVRLDQQYVEVVSGGGDRLRLAQQYVEVITNN